VSLLESGTATGAARAPIVEAPRYSCAFGGAMGATLATFGGVPILHSGAGCGMAQQWGQTLAGGQNGGGPFGSTSSPCSCLQEEHVVFGGEQKLRDLISTSLEVMRGDFFVVITGCVPALIGDDVDAIVREFADRKPIFHVPAHGFSGNSYEGYEKFFESAADQLLEPRPVEPLQVNIFGVVPYQHLFWKGNLAEIKRTLARAGIDANIIFTEFAGLENLLRIPAAALNVVLSPWNGERTAAHLEERFGTPYITFPGVPIGPKQTTALLEAIAAQLPSAAEALRAIVAEEARLAYRFAEYFAEPLVSGFPVLQFVVVADSGTAIGLTQYLTNETLFVPEAVIVSDGPPEEAREEIVRQLTEGVEGPFKPEVIFEIDAHLIRQALRGRVFQLMLGSSLEKYLAQDEFNASHLSVGFPSYDRLIVDRSYAGYRGGLALMEDVMGKWIRPS
jgi:nitrogenase molybdenum-iron protein beta chain